MSLRKYKMKSLADQIAEEAVEAEKERKSEETKEKKKVVKEEPKGRVYKTKKK